MPITALHPRFVIHRVASKAKEVEWCTKTLEKAMEQQGKPEIINTNKGSRFTS